MCSNAQKGEGKKGRDGNKGDKGNESKEAKESKADDEGDKGNAGGGGNKGKKGMKKPKFIAKINSADSYTTSSWDTSDDSSEDEGKAPDAGLVYADDATLTKWKLDKPT